MLIITLNKRIFSSSEICSLSIVVVGVVVVNFSQFHLLLQNHLNNFNQTWHKAFLDDGNSILFKWRASPFQRGDNWRNIKNLNLKKSSSPEPLGQFQPNLAQSILAWWVFKFVLKKGHARPFLRGDNYEIPKKHWRCFKKIFFQWTTGPISTKTWQCILGWREFKFVQMKGPALFQGEIITK